MKTTLTILFMILVLGSTVSFSQTASAKTKQAKSMDTKTMNTYVIEREIPNAGQLSAEELQGISQKSCSVLKELGPDIEWVESYVTSNKIFCIYRAQNEEILRTHAMKGGFPINSINLLSTKISPATATAALADIK
jgi:Protein of unknown function (DUF4242)